jgi:hypothetical protein
MGAAKNQRKESSMTQLIAKVTVVTHANGKRAEYVPGAALPADLPARDVAELRRMGAVEERAEAAATNPPPTDPAVDKSGVPAASKKR